MTSPRLSSNRRPPVQAIPSKEEEAGEQAGAGNPFERRRHGRRKIQDEDGPARALVTFQFCNNDDGCWESCDSSDYEEMAVDMRTYLDIVLKYKREERQTKCEICSECHQFSVIEETESEGEIPAACDGLDTSCHDECRKIENLEDDGYIIDAAEFIACQELTIANGEAYYAGARCEDDGSGIQIGLFREECGVHDPSLDVEQFMDGMTGPGLCERPSRVRRQLRTGRGHHGTFDLNSNSFVPGADGVCRQLCGEAYREEESFGEQQGGALEAADPLDHDDQDAHGETCITQTPGGVYYAGRYC